MAAQCSSCQVNDADGDDGLCGSCRRGTGRIVDRVKRSGVISKRSPGGTKGGRK